VVALFLALVNEAVAAASERAGGRTVVGVVVVAVIAFLAGFDDAVAARGAAILVAGARAGGCDGVRPVFAANVEGVPVTESFSGLAVGACRVEGLAARAVLTAHVALDTLGVQRPATPVTNPELGRAGSRATQLTVVGARGAGRVFRLVGRIF